MSNMVLSTIWGAMTINSLLVLNVMVFFPPLVILVTWSGKKREKREEQNSENLTMKNDNCPEMNNDTTCRICVLPSSAPGGGSLPISTFTRMQGRIIHDSCPHARKMTQRVTDWFVFVFHFAESVVRGLSSPPPPPPLHPHIHVALLLICIQARMKTWAPSDSAPWVSLLQVH